MYSRADKLLAHLKKFIRNEFNRMGLLGFDELNVINTQSQTDTLFTNLKNENIKAFCDAARNAQSFSLTLIALMEKGYPISMRNVSTRDFEKSISGVKADASGLVESLLIGTTTWLTSFLRKYNHTTGYLYESETDRKRMRYNEEILTAREYGDRQAFNTATNKSANLWYNQSEQYLMDVVDEATIETYKNNGIKYVMWMTEMDSRVCKTCQSYHGQIFDIDDTPEKPHRRCRCYLIPMKDKKI